MNEDLKKQGVENLKALSAKADSLTINEWMEYLDNLHSQHLVKGLERVKKVAERLGLFTKLKEQNPAIIAVAGTNGKGSTSALIAQSFLNMGINVGLYTSPHLYKFNERIHIKDKDIEDDELKACLAQVIKAQCEGDIVIELTYFELTTLAAVLSFINHQCELLVLEVGLGARLDAVNIFENDLSVITSIGLDHTNILGDTVQKIAYEKAGIICSHGKVVVGANLDHSAFNEILRVAKRHSVRPYVENIDFSVAIVPKEEEVEGAELIKSDGQRFSATHEICYQDNSIKRKLYLPFPKIPLSCVGPALSAIFKMTKRFNLPLDSFKVLDAIAKALENVALPGRMQLVRTKPDVYLDVAHNVPAANHLRDHLLKYLDYEHGSTRGVAPRIRRAVIGMLDDKDIEGVLWALKDSFDAFYVCSLLESERGANKERLFDYLNSIKSPQQRILAFDSTQEAIRVALREAQAEDEVIVFGSFVTVAAAKKFLDENH